MYKKTLLFGLINVSVYIFSMDTIKITLGSVRNKSGSEYYIIYGQGHQALVDPSEEVRINQPLFSLCQNQIFPYTTKIVLKEMLPLLYPDEAAVMKILKVQALTYYVLKMQTSLPRTRYNLEDGPGGTLYNLENGENYFINVNIDENDNFAYQLTKEEKQVK